MGSKNQFPLKKINLAQFHNSLKKNKNKNTKFKQMGGHHQQQNKWETGEIGLREGLCLLKIYHFSQQKNVDL